MGNNSSVNIINIGGVEVLGDVVARRIVDEEGRNRYYVKDNVSGITITFPCQKKENNSVINFTQSKTESYITNIAYGKVEAGSIPNKILMSGCKSCEVDTSKNGDIADNVGFLNSEKYSSTNNKLILGEKDSGYFVNALKTCKNFFRWLTMSSFKPTGAGTYMENDFYYNFSPSLSSPGNPFYFNGDAQKWR